jgi:formylmethanofuran dehydrogenase subunit E
MERAISARNQRDGRAGDTRFADRIDVLVGVMVGGHDAFQPSFELIGSKAALSYYATGNYVTNTQGIENPQPTRDAIHDRTEQARKEILKWTYEQPDDAVFQVEAKGDFKFTPVKGSFNKTKCSACGEYVFDRYLRTKDGQPVCIPCSGYRSRFIRPPPGACSRFLRGSLGIAIVVVDTHRCSRSSEVIARIELDLSRVRLFTEIGGAVTMEQVQPQAQLEIVDPLVEQFRGDLEAVIVQVHHCI